MTKYNLDEPVPFKAIYVAILSKTMVRTDANDDDNGIVYYWEPVWKKYIKKILRVRTADLTDFIDQGSNTERYLKIYVLEHKISRTARESVPLATVTEEAYNEFITKNKEGLYLAEYEQVPLKKFLQEKGHIVLATPEKDALCFDYDYFKTAYKNKKETWFYECKGNNMSNTNNRSLKFIDLTQPYIKICISKTGMNGYIPAAQIWSMLCSKRKVFFVEPHMVEQEHQMITHTVGHHLALSYDNATMISANHCQHGSSILIFDIHEYASKLRFSGSPTSHGNSDSRPRTRSSSS